MRIDEKEELKLILKIQNGNHSAYKKLHKMYEPIIYIKVRKLKIPYNQREDFVQEGRIALLKAVKHYKKERKVKFVTYANLCIDRHLLTCIRDYNRKKHSILNYSFSIEEPGRNLVSLNQQLSRNNQVEETIVAEQHFNYCCKKTYQYLEGLERIAFKKILQGKTAKEIALEIDREVKAVYAAISRAKKKLHKELDK